MNSYITTLESKSIEEFLPLSKGAGNLCLVELQPQSRLVHTDYKLTYNLRDSFYLSLMIYSLLRIFRLVRGFEKSTPFGNHFKPIIAKSNRTKPIMDYQFIIS